MNACPKCGGISGFGYRLVITTSRRGDWGEDNDEEVDIVYTNNPKTVTCSDCGARVNMAAAHGFEGGNSKTYAVGAK